jgi:hypothetical protein
MLFVKIEILSIYGSTALVNLGLFFSFLIHTQDSLDGGSSRRKAATDTHNKRAQTFMPRVRFEPMIPVFGRAKTVHALDRAASVIGKN